MRVLITGATGQLGRALVGTAPPWMTLIATDHKSLDITDANGVRRVVADSEPALIVNAAAYTSVDKAESHPDEAWQVNALAPALLTDAAQQLGRCRLIHLSTDYVFSGDASRPYKPEDETGPLGVYGASKLEGERAVLRTLGPKAVVLRTAWVYGPFGQNFLMTMLRLMREQGVVRVVTDQVGCPSATAPLSEIVWAIAANPVLAGVYHWTDAGVASWYDFAVAIREEGVERSLVPKAVEVLPITTEEYPTPAVRPRYSLLNSRGTTTALGISAVHWRVRLRQVLDDMNHG